MTRHHLRVRVKSVTRLTNSPSGNPMWRVITKNGAFRTVPDTQATYKISSHHVGQIVDITIDDRGRITHWDPTTK